MKQDDEASFFLELERAAKSLSIGSDPSSGAELRRLLEELHVGAGPAADAEPVEAEQKPA